MSGDELTSGSAVPSLATVFAERAPTLTLSARAKLVATRKREREWISLGVISFRNMDTNPPSEQSVEPPPPLAGEGWGGGLSASEVSVVDPKHPDWKVSGRLRTNARALRKNSTDAERILWSELRGHRLNGASFRRQVPIQNYIADIVCHAAELVIELDGGQQFSDQSGRADARRSAVIEAQGFKVLRFSNLDVTKNRAGVLETIAAVVAERAPTPTLSARAKLVATRKRERGQEKPSS
jgi:very-short-patch-repair endonuclease